MRGSRPTPADAARDGDERDEGAPAEIRCDEAESERMTALPDDAIWPGDCLACRGLLQSRAMRLMREIRFAVGVQPGPVLNSWAGWPAVQGVGPFLVLRARVEGTPDPFTGYICNISSIDRLLREAAIPLCNEHWSGASEADPASPPATCERLLQALARRLAPYAPPGTRWVDWELGLSPHLSYTLIAGDSPMVLMTEAFEFSAAHRLHCPSLSAEENRRMFGKCNNPSGHGHNYRVEVTIGGRPDPVTGLLSRVEQFEGTIKERVIDRFDHKHLNVDCPEFEHLNPSVENIAQVIWSQLSGQFGPARLSRVRVWETAKTYAECSE